MARLLTTTASRRLLGSRAWNEDDYSDEPAGPRYMPLVGERVVVGHSPATVEWISGTQVQVVWDDGRRSFVRASRIVGLGQ